VYAVLGGFVCSLVCPVCVVDFVSPDCYGVVVVLLYCVV